MTRNEVIKLLLIVSGTFQNYQSNETTVSSWHLILNGSTYEHGKLALIAYLKEGNAFAPQPGQIYQKILEVRKDERRKESLKELPAPEITPAQIEKNKQMLADLSNKLASKKAIN